MRLTRDFIKLYWRNRQKAHKETYDMPKTVKKRTASETRTRAPKKAPADMMKAHVEYVEKHMPTILALAKEHRDDEFYADLLTKANPLMVTCTKLLEDGDLDALSGKRLTPAPRTKEILVGSKVQIRANALVSLGFTKDPGPLDVTQVNAERGAYWVNIPGEGVYTFRRAQLKLA